MTTATPLRTLRLARALGTRTLASEAGVTQKTLLTTELGRRRPSLTTIRRLSAALGVAPLDVTEFRSVLLEAAR